MIAVDTSVAVAAALRWHEAHAAALAALPETKTTLLAQVGLETYSVLTRLPPPQRVPASLARDYLSQMFTLPPLTLTPEGYRGLLDLAAAEGITGGAVYDALVGATAREAGATLLTLDRRAAATYQLLRVDYRLAA
jgi:predicted nucleic acid-binding protein